MWHRVWGAASCATLLLFACGKSERNDSDESGAGKTTSSVAGTSTLSNGGSAGTSATTGGVGVTTGGVSATGGAQAVGGMNVTLGGATPEPGEAGAPAAGGVAACNGYLHACGCGCCGVQPSPATCVYPDLGQDLSELTAQDLATKKDSAGCAVAGCSLGQDYFCCAATPPSNDGAKYETNVSIGAYDRIRLYKAATDCTNFVLRQAPPADPADPQAFPVTVPIGWKLETLTTLPCSSSAIGPNAIGAIGSFALRVLNGACVVDAHLSAFFSNDKRELKTVRIDADGVPVSLSVAECK